MKVETFFGEPCLSLVCGRCPKRRILHHVVLLWDAIVPCQVGKRRSRPSAAVDTSVDEALAGGPVRQICKDGHEWAIEQPDLLAAYQRAIAECRRDIVAGFHC
jgi:hypothetical protein